MFLGIGLEYVDTVFQTIKDSDFAQYTITGMKALAILLFLANILKKYNEGIVTTDGHTWGLTPTELAKNFAIVLLVLFSSQVLDVFDGILVAIEDQYRDTAPALLPLQLQNVDLEQDVGALEAAKKAMAILYEALVTPLYGMKCWPSWAGSFFGCSTCSSTPFFGGKILSVGNHAGLFSIGHQHGRL